MAFTNWHFDHVALFWGIPTVFRRKPVGIMQQQEVAGSENSIADCSGPLWPSTEIALLLCNTCTIAKDYLYKDPVLTLVQISKLLAQEPYMRLTAADALCHPFIRQDDSSLPSPRIIIDQVSCSVTVSTAAVSAVCVFFVWVDWIVRAWKKLAVSVWCRFYSDMEWTVDPCDIASVYCI